MQTVKEDPKRRGLLFAGTERGVFVSFDDGDDWQSLQLNLPPTSMRDFAIHDNDLIVATHGRGFWVIDDISALRQVDADVADGRRVPVQAGRRDHPAAEQRQRHADAEGRAAGGESAERRDHRLLPEDAASGPVTIEILDAAGATVRRFSSADPVPAIDPNTLAVNAIWQRAQEPPSAAAGMHRFVWDLRPTPPAGGRGGRGGGGGGGGGRGGLPPVAAGRFP